MVHNWAVALSRRDAECDACMVAEEFEDAGVGGSLQTRRQMLEHIPQRRPGVNHLSEMRARVEGNSGFVRGLNTVEDASGKVASRVRFTDVFIYREGRWQALAGQDTLVATIDGKCGPGDGSVSRPQPSLMAEVPARPVL